MCFTKPSVSELTRCSEEAVCPDLKFLVGSSPPTGCMTERNTTAKAETLCVNNDEMKSFLFIWLGRAWNAVAVPGAPCGEYRATLSFPEERGSRLAQ